MINYLARLWSLGTQDEPARWRRQIALTNQVGIFAAAATAPYQIFFIFYGLWPYLGLFCANLIFIAVYLSVVYLNHRKRHVLARKVMLCNACSHAFIATWFVSSGAGVHLFYFAIGSFIALVSDRGNNKLQAVQPIAIGALFVTSHFAFAGTNALTPLPQNVLDVMFAVSALGVLTLSAIFSFLFHREIDLAEQELTLNNNRLSELSSTDTLTGLANRRQLDKLLAQACTRLQRRFQPLSLVMCDVDFFKAYNDKLGHIAGDVALQRVADALRNAVSRQGDLVARYGGEEFAVVLPNTDEQGARRVADALRYAIADLHLPRADGDGCDQLTISVGATTLSTPAAQVSPEQLLQRADEALYLAKANGRNRAEHLYLETSSVDMMLVDTPPLKATDTAFS
ncbi:MAG TPA: GGDEF domain-containing protein [Pseudomonas xinjiangensis]|uniref:diguanylate cyclase n=2 Tax=root TaxID=1 RepID=A0A7V1BPY1_9GAMM|nr:GGDEF domain-containing protein [Halopseudomonas xinjiangensis]HEC48453.1 GGDEF domain-containing protein [Halopseudomonas xinjiangensis]